jgi:hypothetical protein
MPQPGPWSKKIYALYYARTGSWAPGLLLVLGGDPIPRDLEENARRMRTVFLSEELKREMHETESPRKKKTVTWVNDHGEKITLEGFETEEETRRTDAVGGQEDPQF